MLARVVSLVLDLVPGSVIDRSRRLPVLAPVLRRVLVAASRPLHGRVLPIAHGPAKGLLLAYDETSAVWASGKTERPVQHAIERLVEPESVFFDIGANVGFYTLLGARLVGSKGTVVAFEPLAENAEKLRRNVELNSFANVEVVAQAVSDVSGHRLLDARHSATAALLPADREGSTEGVARVETSSLDDFLAARPDLEPDVVKIDAEGHEVEIIRGMPETLQRRSLVLVCEMHGRDREFVEAVEAAGYLTIGLDGMTDPARAATSGHVLVVPAGHRALSAVRPV